MKLYFPKLLFTVFLLLIILSNGNAQDSIEKVTLTPYIEWLTKKTNELNRKQTICIIDFYDGKPKKIRANFEIANNTEENHENNSTFTIKTTASEIVFSEFDTKLRATVNYRLRIYSNDRVIDGILDEQISVYVDYKTPATIADDFPVVYRRMVSLPKGKYTAEFLIRDVESENNTTKKIKFEIK